MKAFNVRDVIYVTSIWTRRSSRYLNIIDGICDIDSSTIPSDKAFVKAYVLGNLPKILSVIASTTSSSIHSTHLITLWGSAGGGYILSPKTCRGIYYLAFSEQLDIQIFRIYSLFLQDDNKPCWHEQIEVNSSFLWPALSSASCHVYLIIPLFSIAHRICKKINSRVNKNFIIQSLRKLYSQESYISLHIADKITLVQNFLYKFLKALINFITF